MTNTCVLAARIFAAGLMALSAAQALAQDSVSFKNKKVKLVIGSRAGGGNDVHGRIVAKYIGRYLPGNPSVIVQNMPGAGGTTALGFLTHQVKPDGLTFTISSQVTMDPLIFRRKNMRYKPEDFPLLGGMNRGGIIMFIHPRAKDRLFDKKAKPVVIGNVGPVPRASLMPALWGIEYLGWNAKWVTGYPGTSNMMLAYDRGEVDLTATGTMRLIKEKLQKNELFILNQSGTLENSKIVGRPEFGNAPVFYNQMQKVKMPEVSKKALDYWFAQSYLDKWFGLVPRSPAPVVATYRAAFDKLFADPDYLKTAKDASQGFKATHWKDLERLARILFETSPETLAFVKDMMRKQGLKVK